MLAKLQNNFTLMAMCLLLSTVLSRFAVGEERVNIWTHYDFPPFVTGEEAGLFFDLVKMLNSAAEGEFIFEPDIIPRKRLDSYIAGGQQAVVPFVHWSYMGDKDKTKYFWSTVLVKDQNEFVSRASNPIEYDGTIASLAGLRFGGVRGHNYIELEQAISNGELTRVDTGGEDTALLMVMAGRTDFTTMSKPVLNYFLEKNNMEGKVHISKTPRSKFTRHFMVTKGLENEYKFLQQFINSEDLKPVWLDTLKKHGY